MIDLHTHTIHSDGSDSTKQLLLNAENQGLEYLSITDHDSVGAYKDLKDSNVRNVFSGKIIPGVELTAVYNGELVEVLGYGIDTDATFDYIDKHITAFIGSLPQQSILYMKAFAKYGVKFTPEFEYLATYKPEKLFETTIAYSQKLYLDDMRKFPENAKFFDSYEHMMTISEKDFTRLFIYNPKSTLYVDLSPLFISLDKAVEIIHNMGGLAFFAHTYVYSNTIADCLEDIVTNHKLDGLEVSYTTFTNEQTDNLKNICKQNNLLMSCGSDYHGLDIKPANFLGKGTQGNILSNDYILPWADKIKTI